MSNSGDKLEGTTLEHEGGDPSVAERSSSLGPAAVQQQPRKRRGRPPKNNRKPEDTPPSSEAQAAAPPRRGRISRKKFNKYDGVYETEGQVKPKSTNSSSIMHMVDSNPSMDQQRIAQQESIRRQQQQAQEIAQGLFNAVTNSPGSLSMMQARIMSQPVNALLGNPTVPAPPITMHPHEEEQHQEHHHGKTRVTTPGINQKHPQQGTVQPHVVAGTEASSGAKLSSVALNAHANEATNSNTGITRSSQSTVVAKGECKPQAEQQQQQQQQHQQQQQQPQTSKAGACRPKGNGAKRKGNAASADPKKNRSAITIPDDDPQRLVNPLLGLPLPILPAPLHRPSSGGGGGENSAVTYPSEPPAKNVMQASEFLALTHLVYPRPDTFPISYYARTLGFSVPPSNEGKDEREAWIPPSSNGTNFELIRDPTIHHIPPEGRFATQVWKASYDPTDENDDSVLEGSVDPLYQSFLGGSEEWTTTPGTMNPKDKGAGPLKNLLYHQTVKFKNVTPSPKRINEVLKEAEALGLIQAERWLVAPVGKINSNSGTAAGAGAASGDAADGGGGADAVGSASPAVPDATEVRSGLETRIPDGHTAVGDGSTAGTATATAGGVDPGTAAMAGPPNADSKGGGKDQNQMWALAAWHKGRENDEPDLSMVLHYKLQWFQLLSESSNGNRVSELVMRIPFGPVPVALGQLNVLAHPKTEEDYFAGEFLKTEDASTDGLSLRRRLILILYALVLEHARNCSICYCLLQVPASLVSLLQKYFRMTPVPLKEGSSLPDDKRTTLVPMLCDLVKCSTRYALLVQREAILPRPNPRPTTPTILKQRLLVRIPTTREVNYAQHSGVQDQNLAAQSVARGPFRCAPATARHVSVRLQVTRKSEYVGAASIEGKIFVDDPKEAAEGIDSVGEPKKAADVSNGSERPEETHVVETPTSKDHKPAGTDMTDGNRTTEASEAGSTEETAGKCTTDTNKSAEVTEARAEGTDVVDENPTEGAKNLEKDVGNDGIKATKMTQAGTAEDPVKMVKRVMTEEQKATKSATLLLSLKATDAEGKETETIADVPGLSDPPHWDILKSFPMASRVQESQPVTAITNQKQAQDANGVLVELQRQQKELMILEQERLEPKIRSLLGKVIQERRRFEQSDYSKEQEEQARLLAENRKILEQRKEWDEAWQKQMEQDMDAVCEICNDGEVTPDNQILFCEACNVAVHQLCYGIVRVPEGDWYCLACRHFNRKKVNSAAQRQMRYQAAAAAEAAGETNIAAIVGQRPPVEVLPITCELCPVPNGAFVPADNSKRRKNSARDGTGSLKSDDSRWVHMVCAKWQGLNFVERAKPNLLVEDVSDLKTQYRLLGYKCVLCLGERGAFNQCSVEGCDNALHVLCARASNLCDVVHGEDAKGSINTEPWTLKCPAHSSLPRPDNSNQKTAISVAKLVMLAESFPPEPIVNQRVIYANVRPDKPFNKLTGKERQEAFYNVDYEQDLIEELTKKLFGVRCEVCDQWEEDGKNLTRCHCCGVVVCDSCVVDGDNVVPEKRFKYRCAKCAHLAEMKRQKKDGLDELSEPRCAVCCQPGGWLRRAKSEPISKRGFWNHNPKKREKSLFGTNVWCHNLCALWCAPGKINIKVETGVVDMSNVVLSSGSGFIREKTVCFLCGSAKGLKEPCVVEGCHCADHKGNTPFFHPTCARQAGLEVKDDSSLATLFYVKCYRHGGNDFNLRARLEDLIEVETKRAGRGFANQDAPMTFADASRLLNGAILVLRVLGWAWRWSEWWVEYGSNWEPLLEQGQNEEEMTKEQLKIVDSTRESRRDDARRCRLAAFGAALRNRNYDSDDRHAYDYIGGCDHKSLEQALRAVLNTKSLVGPLQEVEIEFLVDWLGRAYRSKSRLLGFGKDKVEVNPSRAFCKHNNGGSHKFELGSRSLPGKQDLKEHQIFEDELDEVDDFDFYTEAVATGEMEHENRLKEQLSKKSTKKKKAPGRGPVRQKAAESRDDSDATKAPKRRPGRPRVKQEAVQEPQTAAEQSEAQPVELGPEGFVSEAQVSAAGPPRDRIQRSRKRARETERRAASAEVDSVPESKSHTSAGSDTRAEVLPGDMGTAEIANNLQVQSTPEDVPVKLGSEGLEGPALLDDDNESEKQVDTESKVDLKVHDPPPCDGDAAKKGEKEIKETNLAEEANNNDGKGSAPTVIPKANQKANQTTKQNKQFTTAAKASALFRPKKKRKKGKTPPSASTAADPTAVTGHLTAGNQSASAEGKESKPAAAKMEDRPESAKSQPATKEDALSEPPQKKQRTLRKEEGPQPEEGEQMDVDPTATGSKEQQLARESTPTTSEAKGHSDKGTAAEVDNQPSAEALTQVEQTSHGDAPAASAHPSCNSAKHNNDEKALEESDQAVTSEKKPDDGTANSQQPFKEAKQDEKCDSFSSSSNGSSSSDSSDSFGPQLRKIAMKQERAAEEMKEEEEEGDCLEDQLTNVATFCEANSHRKKGRNKGKFEAAACFAQTKQGWFGIHPDDEKRLREDFDK